MAKVKTFQHLYLIYFKKKVFEFSLPIHSKLTTVVKSFVIIKLHEFIVLCDVPITKRFVNFIITEFKKYSVRNLIADIKSQKFKQNWGIGLITFFSNFLSRFIHNFQMFYIIWVDYKFKKYFVVSLFKSCSFSFHQSSFGNYSCNLLSL